MAPSITRIVASCQSKPVDDETSTLATDVDQALALLRRCVQETGWTLDALETAMNARNGGRGFDKSLISRVLNGERPLTLSFLLALPDDVESLYESRRAESFGRIVVEPVHGDAAVRNLVSGLVGVLTDRLAEKR